MSEDLFKPSETARARVAEAFGHLPPDAAETAAGWLTLIEVLDAKYSSPPDRSGTAIAARPPTPRELESARRDWMTIREQYTKRLGDLLAYHPTPITLMREDGLILPA